MATLTSKNLFVGYTTVNQVKPQQLADIKIVEQDLLNQFNTIPGERVMMPLFGCKIWNYLYEPFDQSTIDAIIYEAQQVILSDSRVQLQNTLVTEFQYGITVSMDLLYLPFKALSTFVVNFDKRSQGLG